ncbi:MAG: glycosyltransferase, partial [Halobacteriaceae archaeon]
MPEQNQLADMKVGINARVFSLDTPAGAAQVGIQHTSNLLDRSIQCELYGHPNGHQWFSSSVPYKSSFFSWNSQPFGIGWERTVMPALAAKGDLDILFCPNANAPPITAGNHKAVVMIHHVGATHGHSFVQRVYRKSMIPLGVRNADAVVTVSKFSKQKIVERLPISQENVHVVHNGVDELYFDDSRGSPVDLPDDYILFVGSSDERKNLQSLIGAFQQIGTDHELVVVGPSDRAAFGKEGLDRDDISNMGYLTEDELRYVYDQ